jgi:hypothetical protein
MVRENLPDHILRRTHVDLYRLKQLSGLALTESLDSPELTTVADRESLGPDEQYYAEVNVARYLSGLVEDLKRMAYGDRVQLLVTAADFEKADIGFDGYEHAAIRYHISAADPIDLPGLVAVLTKHGLDPSDSVFIDDFGLLIYV